MTPNGAGLATESPDELRSTASHDARHLPRSRTGIEGLAEITGGGLPLGRPTLVCGAAGCGKTLLAMEFLVRGAVEFGEPGAFISFEEPVADLVQNVRSLGFDLQQLMDDGRIAIDHIHIDPAEIEEA